MSKTHCRDCAYGHPPRDHDKNKRGHCKMMLLEFEYDAPGCYWFIDARDLVKNEKEKDEPKKTGNF
nr:MAG TPA: hypothetical protein [Caudoviricetes sp.]